MQKTKLSPKWKKVKTVNYEIYRRDYFRYMDNVRYPIENHYRLNINHLETYKAANEVILEAVYPDGLLKLLTSFQPFSNFIGKEEQFTQSGGNRFSYTVNNKGKLKSLTNIRDLHRYDFWLQTAIDQAILDKKEQKALKECFSYFGEDEVVKRNYLFRDLDILHEFAGLELSSKLLTDLSETTSKIGQIPNLNHFSKKYRKYIKALLTDFEGDVMFRIDQDETTITMNYVWGINLTQADEEDWHDFQQIKDSFIANEFDIEQYHNITLHQKLYTFDKADKVLNTYSHKRRTVGDKMEKLLDTRITRK